MASTYSNLKIELIGTGDQSGTWGTTTNTNLGTAIEEAITGTADVAFSSADVTLTLTNTNTSQTARNLRLNLTGTSGGARNLIVPAIEKQYIINNGLADDVTVKNSTGTGVAVPFTNRRSSGVIFVHSACMELRSSQDSRINVRVSLSLVPAASFLGSGLGLEAALPSSSSGAIPQAACRE